MKITMSIISFITNWLLFIFPLYQGRQELLESDKITAKIEAASKKVKPVSSVFWLFPLLRMYLYKRRIKKILENVEIKKVKRMNM